MVTFMLWVFIVYNYLLLNYYSATAARSIVIVASVTHSVCERITHECINGRRPNVLEVIVASVTHSVCERITHECINGRRPNVVDVINFWCWSGCGSTITHQGATLQWPNELRHFLRLTITYDSATLQRLGGVWTLQARSSSLLFMFCQLSEVAHDPKQV